MNGFERLREQVKDDDDQAVKKVVDYLLQRDDLEQAYLKEDKTVDGMKDFIRGKAMKHSKNGWCCIPDEVVFSWAVMYYLFPNEYLKINNIGSKNKNGTKKATEKSSKNNVISIDEAKKKMNKNETEQISLFGGNDNETD